MFFVSKQLFIQYHGKKCDNPQAFHESEPWGMESPGHNKPARLMIPGSDDVHLDIAKRKESEYPLVN